MHVHPDGRVIGVGVLLLLERLEMPLAGLVAVVDDPSLFRSPFEVIHLAFLTDMSAPA